MAHFVFCTLNKKKWQRTKNLTTMDALIITNGSLVGRRGSIFRVGFRTRDCLASAGEYLSGRFPNPRLPWLRPRTGLPGLRVNMCLVCRTPSNSGETSVCSCFGPSSQKPQCLSFLFCSDSGSSPSDAMKRTCAARIRWRPPRDTSPSLLLHLGIDWRLVIPWVLNGSGVTPPSPMYRATVGRGSHGNPRHSGALPFLSL